MNSAIQFVREAISELKQSTWLTRDQAVDSTKAVIILVAVMSLYISGVDYVLSVFVRTILGR